MRCIPRGKYRIVSQRNPGNHGVPQLARRPFPSARRHQIGSMLRGCQIESDDTLVNLTEQALEGLHERRATLTVRHDLQPNFDFENRNGCDPDGEAGLLVEPVYYRLLRR